MAAVRFSENGAFLTWKGLKIDTVDGLGISFLLDADRWPLERKNSMFQSAKCENAYDNDDALKDALWKTLVGNRDLIGNTAPESYKCLFDAFSWACYVHMEGGAVECQRLGKRKIEDITLG